MSLEVKIIKRRKYVITGESDNATAEELMKEALMTVEEKEGGMVYLWLVDTPRLPLIPMFYDPTETRKPVACWIACKDRDVIRRLRTGKAIEGDLDSSVAIILYKKG